MSTPRNATELYEFLRESFGVGNYDETQGIPYWRYAQLEAVKINSTVKRRRTSIEELHVAALFALDQRIPVTGVYDLLGLIPRSKVAARRAAKGDPRQDLVRAAEEAQAAGAHEWAARLYGAHPSLAAEVLAEWEAAK